MIRLIKNLNNESLFMRACSLSQPMMHDNILTRLGQKEAYNCMKILIQALVINLSAHLIKYMNVL
jgi:hypothetical protein